MVGIHTALVAAEVIESLFGDRANEDLIDESMCHYLSSFAMDAAIESPIASRVEAAGPFPARSSGVDPVSNRAIETTHTEG